MTSRMDGSKLCLMPTEDKVSTGLGLRLLINFDGTQEGDVPNMTTMHAKVPWRKMSYFVKSAIHDFGVGKLGQSM